MIDFLAPHRLYLLLALVPIGIFLVWAERVRRVRCAAFGATPATPRLRVAVPLLIVATLTVALARPYSGYHDIPIKAQGRDLMVVVDVSMSMLASDAAPSRLEVAKRKIFDVIELASTGPIELRMGIITFSGDAFRFCPLTSDLEIVRTFAENLSPELMTSQGSSLEAAVNMALQTLARVGSNNAAVLIMSDGEDPQFRLSSVEEAIRSSGTQIFTIGIGSEQGSPIPIRSGRFFADPRGNIVITRLTEQPLQELASTSGGAYQRAELSDADLSRILRALPHQETKGEQRAHIRAYDEVGPWLIVAALLTVLLCFAARSPQILFLLPLLVIPSLSALGGALVFYPLLARAEEAAAPHRPPSLAESYQAYERGDFNTALAGLEAAHKQDPLDKAAAEGLARTLYRLGRFQESGNLFDQLATRAKNGRELFNSTYNSANAALMAGEYDTAITKYERALSIKPGDTATTSNLELAKRLKEEHQQNRASSSSSSSSQQSSDTQHQSSENQGEDAPKEGAQSEPSEASSQSASSSSQQSSGSSQPASQSASAQDDDASSSTQSESSSSASSLTSSSVAATNPPTPKPDALKALNDLEDKPLLPKQPRNRDNPAVTGQTW